MGNEISHEEYLYQAECATCNIKKELLRAKELFPEFYNSSHEALAVIREEYVEFEQEVFKNPRKVDYDLNKRQKEEVTQLAAMCLRFLVEL